MTTEDMLRKQLALFELLEKLARAVNEAASAEDAMRRCLASICEHGAWAVGRAGIFKEDAQTTAFPEQSFWHTDDAPACYAEFMRASTDGRFYSPNGQFMRYVLGEKRPVWFSPIRAQKTTGRMAVALRHGLHCAFGFPVVVQEKVVAVLEFFAKDARDPDRLLLENITHVGAQLARLVERSRADALRGRLAAIVEYSADAMMSRGLDNTALTWNPAAERMFGYAASEIVGRDISIIIPPERRSEMAETTLRLQNEQVVLAYDTLRMTKDGRRIPVSLTLSPIRNERGEMTAVSINFRDITARLRAEAQQRASEARVRNLLHRLDDVQEEERQRIAADLHDAVGQNLSALGFELTIFRAAMSAGKERDVAAALDNMERLIGDTTNSVREAIADLRPALLDDYGVFAAIEGYASRLQRLAGLRISVRGNASEARLPRRTELGLFRIAQEALTNVAKHALASEVNVELSHCPEGVKLLISDDGKGLGARQNEAQPGGWGLHFMKERAEALGGKLQISSSENGTKIIVEIPLGDPAHTR